MSRLRVCVVSQQYSEVLSGPGLYARNLVHGLLARGHTVSLVVPRGVGKDCPNGVKVIEAGKKSFVNKRGRWLILSFFFGRKLKKLSKTGAFDLYHFSDAKEAFFSVRLKETIIGNINDPYIASRSLNPFYYRKNYPIDWVVRWLYLSVMFMFEGYALRRLRCGICNSHFTRNVIATRYGVPDKHLTLCYKSIRLESYTGIPQSRNDDQKQTVLFVGGGNAQRKGLINFLKAANIVSHTLPHVQYIIIGRDKSIPKILRVYGSKRIKENVTHIVGVPNEQMSHLYAKAVLFVMPSLIEAFGVVYLEAMACGTPVIATSNGGSTELILHEENGLLVKPGDIQGLAKVIDRVLTDDVLWANLSRNGRQTVNQYSSEKMLNETIRIYEKFSTNNALKNV